jgi:hypothetical protein
MGCGRSKAYHVAEDNEEQLDIEATQRRDVEPARQLEPRPASSVQELSEVMRVRRLRALPPVPAAIPAFPIVPAFSQNTTRESVRLSTFSEPAERNKLFSPCPGSPTRRISLGPPSSLGAGLPSRSAKLAKLFGPPRGVESSQVAGSSQHSLPQSFRDFQQPGQSLPVPPQLRTRRTSREAKPYSPAAQSNMGNRALARPSGRLESKASPPPPPTPPPSSLWPFSTASPGSKSSTPSPRQPWSSASVSLESKGKEASRTTFLETA